MFYAYVLRSEKTGRFYTGSCEDLEDRLARHSRGESAATRHGVLWTLVFQEAYPTRAEAVRRERHLKTGRGREKLRTMLR